MLCASLPGHKILSKFNALSEFETLGNRPIPYYQTFEFRKFFGTTGKSILNFTKLGMLFLAVLIFFLNSNVCLIGNGSIVLYKEKCSSLFNTYLNEEIC